MLVPFRPFGAAFCLDGPGHRLSLHGCRRALRPGPLESLSSRSRSFFAAEPEGPRLLAGAVPYDPAGADCLFQPERRGAGPLPVAPTPPGRRAAPPRRARLTLRPEPDLAQYRRAVGETLAAIARGELEKLVLSRSLCLRDEAGFDHAALLAALRRDPAITVFACPLPPRGGRARTILGATPELLIAREGRRLRSHPLAGSARRAADPAQDRAVAEGLLASSKDRHEHRLVVEAILDALTPFCRALSAPEGTRLTATAQMWHLGTEITGTLRSEETDCATLLAAIHPTPAVCGTPRPAAEALRRRIEGHDRGFYAGAVGWLEENGDGVWYLTLRCAEICGIEARLYAGAGVVAGSTPEAEAAETTAKLGAMMAAFGLANTPPEDKEEPDVRTAGN